jgi:parvulin-like peptidyl-prolyl isomerase
MKTRLLLLSSILALVAVLAAGCGGGGGSSSVPSDDIAKVGSTPISKDTFNSLMNVAVARFKAQGQQAPKVGTAAYTQLRDQAVSFLVQEEELTQEGQKLGVTVSQKDINDRLDQIRQTSFGGSEKKLEDALKKDHITLEQLDQYNLRPSLLSSKLQTKVTQDVKVSDSAAKSYYDQNKSSFKTPAETTRDVRHILVDSKSLANQLEKKLKNGADFAVLAKKYSKDTGSAQSGGKLTAVKGQLVKPFQDVAFSLKTGQISPPVHSQFGWHIIQALGPVKNTPARVTPFAQAKTQIESSLSQQQKQAAWTAWLAKLAKDFKGKVAFQTGFAPVTTTTATTPPTTTG